MNCPNCTIGPVTSFGVYRMGVLDEVHKCHLCDHRWETCRDFRTDPDTVDGPGDVSEWQDERNSRPFPY